MSDSGKKFTTHSLLLTFTAHWISVSHPSGKCTFIGSETIMETRAPLFVPMINWAWTRDVNTLCELINADVNWFSIKFFYWFAAFNCAWREAISFSRNLLDFLFAALMFRDGPAFNCRKPFPHLAASHGAEYKVMMHSVAFSCRRIV